MNTKLLALPVAVSLALASAQTAYASQESGNVLSQSAEEKLPAKDTSFNPGFQLAHGGVACSVRG